MSSFLVKAKLGFILWLKCKGKSGYLRIWFQFDIISGER